MKSRNLGPMRNFLKTAIGRLQAAQRGNILVYIVMIMVIFGLLGALMVSLFSTSVGSSATANEVRRALYFSEAGLRYGMSELRNQSFSESIIDALNDTIFKLQPSGEFDLNIFSNWFEFDSGPDIGGGGTATITVDIPEGEIPQGIWSSAPGSLYLVECNYIDRIHALSGQNPQDSAVASVSGFSIDPNDLESLDIQLSDEGSDGFAQPEKGAQLCFAVKPDSDQTISSASPTLKVDAAARGIFPESDGAIEVNKRPLFYRKAVDKGSYVELTDLAFASWDPVPGSTPEAVQTSDYVILSPINYVVVSEGQSGSVTFGGDMDHSVAIANRSQDYRKYDIGEENLDYSETGNFKQNESTSDFFRLDETEKSVTIGGGAGDRFGSVFFRDTRNIGGVRNYCQAGGCFFDRGFRAFFILNFSGSDGDGLTFSVINQALNDAGSVGGDVQLSELLAYAGDSRTVADPSGPGDFLDGKGEGLEAPKMALEFDGKVNNQNFRICADAATVNPNTRNDPGFGGVYSDGVHYTFWGSGNLINAPCRVNPLTGTNKTYDDNRHDGINELWVFSSGGARVSSPIISSGGGSIYIGRSSNNGRTDAGRLLKVDRLNGSQTWSKNPDVDPVTGLDDYPNNDDDVESSPSLSAAGHIYVGSDSDQPGLNTGLLAKFNSSGTRLAKAELNGDVKCRPAVSNARAGLYDGNTRIYVTTTAGGLFALAAANLAGIGADAGLTDLGSSTFSSPVVRYDAAENTNYIYVGAEDGSFFTVRDNGDTREIREKVAVGGAVRTIPALNPVNGDVYFGANDNKIHIFTKNGLPKASVLTGGDVLSSPTVSSNGRTVYAGSDDGRLYRITLDASGNPIQTLKYPPAGQSALGPIRGAPAIDTSGVVYFGSDDGHLYALNVDGTLKWKYPETGSIAAVRSKPVLRDGIVYFGAEDGKLYAVEFAVNDPPNKPDLYLAPDVLGAGSGSNWLTDGPWAVRLEVQRSQTANASGKYEYTLKSWMKKCQDAGCTNVLGKFFEGTRFEYDWAGAGITPMTQTIELSQTEHDRFYRFLFGFTSATSAFQQSTITKFQLSFIRPGDPKEYD